jgi:hypothetical protein
MRQITGEQRCRHFEAKCLGGFEIDHELVFSRCLQGQVGWLLALEDAIERSRLRAGTGRLDQASRRLGRRPWQRTEG